MAPNLRYTVAFFSHQIIYCVKKRQHQYYFRKRAEVEPNLRHGQQNRRPRPQEQAPRGRPRLPPRDMYYAAFPALTATPCLTSCSRAQPRARRHRIGSHRLQPQEPAQPAPPQRPQLGRRRHLGAGAPLPAPPGAAEGPQPWRVTDTPPDAGEQRLAPSPRHCEHKLLTQSIFWNSRAKTFYSVQTSALQRAWRNRRSPTLVRHCGNNPE